MRTASTAYASAFPRPSRTIFALVVQACLPSPCPRTRSTCSSPGARVRDPPPTTRRYPRCYMPLNLTPLSLRVRSALYGPYVPRRIDAHTVLYRLSSGSYLRLAEPACMPSHLYPNHASYGLSAQSCSSSFSGLCATFSLAGLCLLKPYLYQHSPRTLLLLNPRLLLNRLSAGIMNSTRAPPIEPVSQRASK
jgi:hypothetical protein